MAHILICIIASSVLICLDVLLRGDLIHDNRWDYVFICLLLFGFILSCRLLISLIPKPVIRKSLAFIFVIFFTFIYWLQSAVYTVYFQFINAADLGIVFGNLNYWSKGSQSLLTLINLKYLLAYFLIFSFVFFAGFRRSTYKRGGSIPMTALLGTVLASVILVSGFYIKQQQLYFLATPIMSLTYELKKFYSEKDRFMKSIADNNTDGYYKRKTDDIQNISRRGNFNVLFLVLESMRQDHMSLYGYERDTTPFQRQRFKQALHFKHAVSNATSTDTSAETIFTGMDWTNPKIHETSLLWSYLEAAGLNQFYVGSHWLQWNGWFGRAFLSEDVDSIQAPLAVDASLTGYDMITARKFKQTVAEFAEKDEPFFGVVHFAGTHYPYVSPKEYHHWLPADDKFEPDQVKEIINKYDNAIAYNDAAIASVVKQLDDLNLTENTIIIATADHGEAMYEHKQFFHGKVFWQEGIDVPLYIDIPEQLLPLFSDEELNHLTTNTGLFVSTVDLFPTILDLYNIPLAKTLDGYSLLKSYPESLIRVYMIPEEYALINSHSGEKYHIDNAKKILRYTRLREDPNEQDFAQARLDEFVPIGDMIKQVRSKQFLSKYSLNQ